MSKDDTRGRLAFGAIAVPIFIRLGEALSAEKGARKWPSTAKFTRRMLRYGLSFGSILPSTHQGYSSGSVFVFFQIG